MDLKYGAIIAGVLVASAAQGAPIEFTYTGVGNWRLNGVTFTNSAFTIHALGDTANRLLINDPYQGYYIDHSTATFDITGMGSVTITTPTRTFVNNSLHAIGFSRAGADGTDIFDGPQDAGFDSWDMLSSIGPTSSSTAALITRGVSTSGGTLIFIYQSPVPGTFEAVVTPEPSASLVVLLGCVFKSRRRRA